MPVQGACYAATGAVTALAAGAEAYLLVLRPVERMMGDCLPIMLVGRGIAL